MNWFNSIIVLAATFLVVFFAAVFNAPRAWLGVQIDFLPSLLVCAALNYGLGHVTLVAVAGGLLFDSLSANPLGVSMLPLFLAGFVIARYRSLILRESLFAQVTLGLGASAAVPVLTLLLLLNAETQPLVSWFSLWQWVFTTAVGAAVTPLWFWFFDRVHRAVNYRPWGEVTFRPDREIKRGRQ